MRKILTTIALCLSMLASAQTSYMTDHGAAVFVPKNYDAQQHLPSPIFLRELTPQSAVPQTWQLRPVFSTAGNKTLATVSVGDADLYGTGEVYGDLRRNGETEGLWNKDNGLFLTEGGKRLYQSHPWVLGVRKDGTAFGVIFDSTWKSRLTTDSNIVFESEGPAFRVIIIEEQTPQLVLQTLGKLSGTMELPPLWSLGFQQSRFSYYPDTQVKEIADEFRQRQIPCDVIWMDINYMDGFRIFTFNKDGFPNPKATNDYLHQQNYHSVYMIDPGVKVDPGYFVYDQGTAGNYWVKDKDGNDYVGKVWPGDVHFPDYTRPEVRQWWATLYKDFMALGIDGVWNDMNEPSDFTGPDGSMPETNIHLGGNGLAPGTHLRYHNVFGYNMVKASREGILAANPDKRPFLLSRSNFLGGQRLAATWTGDNESSPTHMKMSIPMTLNMGLTGQAFNGPDMGGFAHDCTPDLLAQWTASGIYFPFTRNHCSCDEVRQEPWAFGKEVEDVCRTAINRRYQLLPYLYTCFRAASTDNQPVMQPVFFADTKDLSLRSEQQAYMLGTDLLIIPRWAENPALPKGNWSMIPFETDKKGRAIDDGYQATVALRPGAIVPTTGVFQNTVEYNTDCLTLLVNLDDNGKAEGTMYEDAGDGFGYKSGDYAIYTFKAEKQGKTMTLTMQQTDGKRQHAARKIRAAIVKNGKITYSEWTDSNTVTMKIK